MSRFCSFWLWAFLAAALSTGAAGSAAAQFSDEDFVTEEVTAPARAVPRVPLPDRRPRPPAPQASDNGAEEPLGKPETASATGLPEKKPQARVGPTTAHETSDELASAGQSIVGTAGHEARIASAGDMPVSPGLPERTPSRQAARSAPDAQVTGAIPAASPGEKESEESAPAPDAQAAAPEKEKTQETASLPDAQAAAPDKEMAQESVPAPDAGATGAEKEETQTSAPAPDASAVRDQETPQLDPAPESGAPPPEKPAAGKRPQRTVALPVRKPPKPHYDPSPAKERARKKPPAPGGRKTREQQCAALTLCRNAFTKCRFSKEREKTDEEGWETHKKYCGDEYNKCITRHFGEGEMFFTRWFLPYNPCS